MDEDVLRQILAEVKETNQFNRKMHRFYSVFVIIMLIMVIATPFLMRSGSFINHEDAFRTKARRLIHDNKPQEVIPLADNYIKQEPLNPYGPWYMALAEFHLGNFQVALQWFDKAQELAPTWEENYIAPYRAVIEKKLKSSSHRDK